ncbi:hypothetical protein [Janibacter anophelis]|nr:hypothetical protein [Janibacter anophelis]
MSTDPSRTVWEDEEAAREAALAASDLDGDPVDDEDLDEDERA